MLSKKYRLTRKQVGYVYQKGKRFSLGEIGVKYFPNRLEHARFAINIPAKVYKKAVDRNHLRRIIYDEVGKLPILGYDFIISLYKSVDEENIRSKTKEIFNRIR